MSVLNVIRNQENPDGEAGHNERLQLQDASRKNPPKRVYTRWRDFHKYSQNDIRKNRFDKTMLLFAKEYCHILCCNYCCPMRGI